MMRATSGPAPAELVRGMDGRGIFLLAFTRSGTTLFTHLLTTHPRIVSFGEVLNEGSGAGFFRDYRWRALRDGVTPSALEAGFYRFARRRVDGAGGRLGVFDLKIQNLHLIEGNWRLPGQAFRIFDILREAGAPVVLIERRGLVARHLSSRLARRRERFHSFSAGTARKVEPFAIDVPALEAEIGIIRAQHAAIRTAFAGHERFLDLTFENMLVRGEAEGESRFAPDLTARLAAILGVEDKFDPTPRTDRMAPADYGGLITNYDEVERLRARLDA